MRVYVIVFVACLVRVEGGGGPVDIESPLASVIGGLKTKPSRPRPDLRPAPTGPIVDEILDDVTTGFGERRPIGGGGIIEISRPRAPISLRPAPPVKVISPIAPRPAIKTRPSIVVQPRRPVVNVVQPRRPVVNVIQPRRPVVNFVGPKSASGIVRPQVLGGGPQIFGGGPQILGGGPGVLGGNTQLTRLPGGQIVALVVRSRPNGLGPNGLGPGSDLDAISGGPRGSIGLPGSTGGLRPITGSFVGPSGQVLVNPAPKIAAPLTPGPAVLSRPGSGGGVKSPANLVPTQGITRLPGGQIVGRSPLNFAQLSKPIVLPESAKFPDFRGKTVNVGNLVETITLDGRRVPGLNGNERFVNLKNLRNALVMPGGLRHLNGFNGAIILGPNGQQLVNLGGSGGGGLGGQTILTRPGGGGGLRGATILTRPGGGGLGGQAILTRPGAGGSGLGGQTILTRPGGGLGGQTILTRPGGGLGGQTILTRPGGGLGGLGRTILLQGPGSGRRPGSSGILSKPKIVSPAGSGLKIGSGLKQQRLCTCEQQW